MLFSDLQCCIWMLCGIKMNPVHIAQVSKVDLLYFKGYTWVSTSHLQHITHLQNFSCTPITRLDILFQFVLFKVIVYKYLFFISQRSKGRNAVWYTRTKRNSLVVSRDWFWYLSLCRPLPKSKTPSGVKPLRQVLTKYDICHI